MTYLKKLMIGVALAGLATAPALANQSMSRHRTSAAYGAYGGTPGSDAYAMDDSGAMAAGPPPVYEDGQYQGTDPDPFIRQQLLRDPSNVDRE